MASDSRAPHRQASSTPEPAWPPPPEGALFDLAEAMPHAVAITDRAGRITWANRRGFTRLMTGFDAWDTAGRSFTGLVRLGGTDAGPTLDVGDALATGAPCGHRLLHRKDGTLRWADLDMYPVALDGAVVAHVALLTDVTERERTSTRLANAERLATFGTLASGVAHEIATRCSSSGDSVTSCGRR
ncbi:MAG: PAS domain-containing protein [Vicinamibacterales bacterium]